MTPRGTEIDWSAVRRKLAAGRRALEQSMALDPEQLEALFRERARALMERRRDKGAEVAATAVLAFASGAERFAIDVAHIVEVLPLPPVTPLPAAAPEVLGLVNLRGDFLTVVGLDRLLGVARREDAAEIGHLVVLAADGNRLGLAVDTVERIRPLRLDNLSSPPGGRDRGADAGFAPIKGVSPEDALIVVDGPAVVARFMDKGET